VSSKPDVSAKQVLVIVPEIKWYLVDAVFDSQGRSQLVGR